MTTGVEEFLLTGGASTGSIHGQNAGTKGGLLGHGQPSQSCSELSNQHDGTAYGQFERSPPNSGGSIRHQQGGRGGDKILEESDEDEEVTESDKHYVQSGPSWQEKAPLFQVRVHDPETRRKMVGMQEYTLFQVTSTVITPSNFEKIHLLAPTMRMDPALTFYSLIRVSYSLAKVSLLQWSVVTASSSGCTNDCSTSLVH